VTRSVRSIATAGVLLAASLANASAHAEPATRAKKRIAEASFRQGLALSKAYDFEGALASFSAAYATLPSVDILWNLAASERRAGHPVEALEHLRAYLTHPRARDEKKRIATSWIAELEGETGVLLLVPVADGEVRVDGVTRRAGELRVTAGAHVVEVRRANVTQTLAVEVAGGGIVAPSLALFEPENASTTSTNAAPPVAARQPETTVDREPNEPRSQDPRRISRWLPLGLAGGAIVAVGGGVALGLLGLSARDDADAMQRRISESTTSCKRMGSLCDDYASARSSAQRLEVGATGLFVIGGVLSGAAIVAWAVSPSGRTQISPTIGPTGVAGSLTHTF
jgi:hypothetical protein